MVGEVGGWCSPTLPTLPRPLKSRVYSDCQPFQSAITCSKLTVETLEQGVEYVQS